MIRKLVLLAALAAALSGCGRALDCPPVNALRTYRPPQASRVYAADGSLIAHLSPQRRVVVEFTEFPRVLTEGVIAVEDRRFHDHGGVDLRGVVRAVWRDVTSFSLREGFSTLTMQLARNVFEDELPRDEKFRRKACEVWMAPRIEDAFSKQQILELYLNQIYLGDGLYGMQAAADGYFAVPVPELTPAQAALLIALLKNPEGYNPRKNPLRAIERRNIVLRVMAREGVITPTEASESAREPLRLAPPPEAAGPAPYFVAAVRRALRSRFGEAAEVRGLQVHTGLHPDLQRSAADALRAQLDRIEAGSYGRYRYAPYAQAKAATDAEGTAYLQGMIMAMDPHNGEVRALVGGRDYRDSQYDRAMQARRQPGSAFKPIVYAAAIEAGLPVTARIETTDVVIDDSAGAPPWAPSDHVADTVHTLTVRDALALSSNAAAVRVGRWIGEERVIQMAHDLGITADIPPYPSIHLGAADIVPAEMVAAYAPFANGGFQVRPQLITRVEDARGRVLWRAPDERRDAIDAGVAYLTLSLMEDVVDRGTASVIREQGFWLPAAGKTGTTNDDKDAWFIGMTPDLVAGVWIGFDRPAPIVPGGGGRLAAPVWANFMQAYYAQRPPPAPWAPPPSLMGLPVDGVSGQVATGNCPPDQVRVEYFIPGTQPSSYCPLHPESGAERLFDRLRRGLRNVF